MNSFKLIQLNYLTFYVLDNPYMFNVISFVKNKFDTEENKDIVMMIGINYSELIPHCRTLYPNKKLIVYNCEQLVDNNKWVNIHYLCESMRGADEIWDYDYLNAKYLKLYYDIEVDKIIPFSYYPEIEIINNKDNPQIDILFYGGFNQKRAKTIASLWEVFYNKYKVVVMFGQTIEENLKYIENSKIILNLHGFEPYNRQQQEKISFLIGNKKCVISELSQENYFGDAIIECSDIQEICANIKIMLSGDRWKSQGKYGYEKFKNNLCEKINNY